MSETRAFGPHLAIERHRLDNGLTLLLCVDKSAPVVSYQTWYAVGSRHEREGKTGLAHMLEHLMFNETKNVPYGAFDRRLESAGAESNAATFLDWTYYLINAPAEAIELIVDLESERMQHLVLRDEQVTSEREVVVNERLQCVDDDVDGTISEELFRQAFTAHGYGRPTIGWMADIEKLSPADCQAFYSTYYAPNNATLVVVGDVERDKLLDLVTRRYGAIGASELPIEDVRPEPVQTAERRVDIDQPTPTPKISIGYKSPAMGDFDHPALMLLCDILFGGRSSRGYRKVVHELELASEVGASLGSFRDPSLFEIGATARDGVTPERVIAEIDALLSEVRSQPPTQAELDRARAHLELATLQGMHTVGGKAEQIGFCELVLGDPSAPWTRLEALARVGRSDLLRVARRYLLRDARTVVVALPNGESDHEHDDDEGHDHEAHA